MAGDGTAGLESRRDYPGWRVVAICFVIAVFAWSFGFYGQSVYVARLREIHGWPVATVAAAATTYYLVSAVLVVFTGDAISRFGARPVLGAGIGLLAAGAAATGWARTLPEVYGGYLLLACGWAATSIAAITSTLGAWFEARRGLAISLALNGASAGGIVGPPMLVWAIERFGFAEALTGGAALTSLVLLPLVLLAWPSGKPSAPAGASAPSAKTGSARALALRSPPFWTMTLAFAAGLFVQVGFVVHLVTLATPLAGPRAAGSAVSATAVAAVIGRLAVGAVIDRIDVRVASAASLALQAFALLVVAGADGYPRFILGSVLFGLSVGNLITLPSLIVHREFARSAFATVVSLSTAIVQLTYAFGPGAIGWLRDQTGGYGLALTICAAIDIAAAALVLAGRRAR